MFKATSKKDSLAGPSNTAGEVKQHDKAKGKENSSGGPYEHRLNFYDRPPVLDITLEEFETCAIERLRVLAHIESLSHRSLPYPQLVAGIASYAKQHLPLSSNSAHSADKVSERRRDEIGHWVLRLAFCRRQVELTTSSGFPDLRARFLRTELALFRNRFESDDADERDKFLKLQKFGWGKVTDKEKEGIVVDLRKCLPRGTTREQVEAEKWFKVPWYNVPDLVGARKVYIRGGMAYVPQSMQISLVLQEFSARLEKALELTARNLPRLDEDERLGPVIDHLAASFLSGLAGSDYHSPEGGADGVKVTAEMVDDIARKHFPACMLNLYSRLKRDKHMKHFGRLQLTLFLKGLGLPLEEAIVFWRRMYGSSMTDDKFNKEYKYNIRHNYGQEGQRRNYQPRNCQTILTQNQPGTQDAHGCPFRHFSPDNLVTFLSTNYPQLDRSGPEMRDILDSVKTSHYHVACTRVFEVTHGLKKGEGLGGKLQGENVSHPNSYTERSREMEKEKMAALGQVDQAQGGDVEMAS